MSNGSIQVPAKRQTLCKEESAQKALVVTMQEVFQGCELHSTRLHARIVRVKFGGNGIHKIKLWDCVNPKNIENKNRSQQKNCGKNVKYLRKHAFFTPYSSLNLKYKCSLCSQMLVEKQ